MLTRALQTSQHDLDTAMNELGVVESERLDGIARIESIEKRVEEIRAHIEKQRRETENEVASRIASFQKFEKMFWRNEEDLHSQLGFLG